MTPVTEEARPAERHARESTSTEILRWRAGNAPRAETDNVAREEPLEILVDGRSVAVTMRTPGHDKELAAGFLISEGLIRKRGDLRKIAHDRGCEVEHGENILNIFLAPEVEIDFKRLTRHVFASSSC